MYGKNRLFHIAVYFILLFSVSVLSHADTEGTIGGNMRLYLYDNDTGNPKGGVNDIYASLGDTITVEAWIYNVLQEPITQISFYVTVDSDYFDVVQQYVYPNLEVLGQFAPFIQGDFMAPANPEVYALYGNISFGDKTHPNDNEIPGWQLNYIEQTRLMLGQEQGASTLKYGTLCKFQLVAKAVCDSVRFYPDEITSNNRFVRYDIREKNDSFTFRTMNPCYITVSGAKIDPPLPDILIAPGASDSTTVDLDDHVNIAALPDSLFSWNFSGNTNISVSIDSLTNKVTFTSPPGYRGYNDIIFTLSDANDPELDVDTLRVSSGATPVILESALPDTLYVYEDSLQVVLNLPDIVTDIDNAYETLTWEFSTGNNITASKSDSSLVLQGTHNFNGADSLKITVKDDMELMATVTRPIWVYPVNDPPTLSGLPDVSFERTKSFEVDLTNYSDDVDNDPLTVNYSTPDNFTLEINGMTATIREKAGFVGTEELILMVSDSGGLSAADTLAVEVTPLYGLPVWSKLPKVGFAQNTSYTDLILWDYVSDPDGLTSEMTFEFSNYDDVDSIYVSPANGRLYLYDLDDTPGWDMITVKAIDYDKNESSTQFLVFIGPADGTPIVAAIPDTTIRAGTVSEWIDLDNYYYDVDNVDNEMTWTWAHSENDSLVVVEINSLFREVSLETVYPDSVGSDKILFTVTDPDSKSASDESVIKVLGETKPILDMPAKIGFVTGVGKTVDVDNYAADPDFDNSLLLWSWNGNANISVAIDTEDSTSIKPVRFSSADGWTGVEKVFFAVKNPLNSTALDSTLVFSVPADGSPVIGGFSRVRVKAGLCDSLNIDLDNYFYDNDTDERFMTWSVTDGDSITVSIDPTTHEITFCAPSSTFEGRETFTITVSDGVHSDSMNVVVDVYGAYIGDVFSLMTFRNPMQGDYMDFYISSDRDLLGVPTLNVMVVGDTTDVVLSAVSDDSLNYYHGYYLLPYDASLGLQQDAIILANGTTSTNKVVQDTLGFSYGRYGPSGGKIALGDMSVDVPENALTEIEMLTLTAQSVENNAAGKIAVDEIIFKGDSYTLAPTKLISQIPLDLSFNVCCRTDGAGVYRMDRDGWNFVGGTVTDNILRTETNSGGIYRVGFDRVSPKIELISSIDGTVTFTAVDFGSGIDSSSIRLAYHGKDIEFAYDADNSIVTVELSEIFDTTDVSLDVFISDRSGNETVKFLNTTVEPKPGQFSVKQNMPNPFNPTTAITFINTSGQKVKIEIFDTLGRKVKVLTDDFYSPGTHKVIWNAVDDSGNTVSNGTYIYTVVSGSHTITRKMLFLK
ncbi:Ig-like domain-containing protein [Candidatus Latescibacterota bacterium]